MTKATRNTEPEGLFDQAAFGGVALYTQTRLKLHLPFETTTPCHTTPSATRYVCHDCRQAKYAGMLLTYRMHRRLFPAHNQWRCSCWRDLVADADASVAVLRTPPTVVTAAVSVRVEIHPFPSPGFNVIASIWETRLTIIIIIPLERINAVHPFQTRGSRFALCWCFDEAVLWARRHRQFLERARGVERASRKSARAFF